MKCIDRNFTKSRTRTCLVQMIKCCCCCCCLVINSESTQPPSPECIQTMKGTAQATKSKLRSTKHESSHRTIEAPRTPRSRGGGRTNAAFMPPRTIKKLESCPPEIKFRNFCFHSIICTRHVRVPDFVKFRSIHFNFPVPERYTYLSGTWNCIDPLTNKSI